MLDRKRSERPEWLDQRSPQYARNGLATEGSRALYRVADRNGLLISRKDVVGYNWCGAIVGVDVKSAERIVAPIRVPPDLTEGDVILYLTDLGFELPGEPAS
jgi:hypothetical protein